MNISRNACRQDKERPGKPEDVVRLYDGMATFATDLGELATDVGGAAGEALIDQASAQVRAGALTNFCHCPECRTEHAHRRRFASAGCKQITSHAQVAQFEAARCFYTALSFATAEQHVQAYSLMDRAAQRVEAAVRKWKVQLLLHVWFACSPFWFTALRSVAWAASSVA